MVFTVLAGCPCPLCNQNIATVRAIAPFDAEKDAGELKEAMRGWGCNNEVITKILGNRTASQRADIEAAYKNLYGKDLLDDLKSELGGNFERLVVALMMPWPYYCARVIKKAMKGMGTDEGTLVDFLCSANNCEIKKICEAYKESDGDELESDLRNEITGDFQNLMVAVCQAARHEDDPVDNAKAAEDAQKIFEAGEMKIGTDESAFTAVLVRNSYAQLSAVSSAYEALAGKTLEEACESELSGDLLMAAKTILAVAKNKDAFWASKLHEAMAGLGTDDKALINIVVLRSETDLGNIAIQYERMYEKPLTEAIEGECSGDYKKLLLDILT